MNANIQYYARGRKMKKKLYPISFLTFLILFSASSGFSGQAAGPRIFFEENVFDAKEIEGGEYLEHTFKVYNRGDTPLEISEVRTT